MKLNELPDFARNTSSDNYFVLSGIIDDFYEAAMISKSGESFLQIEVTPITKPEEKT